MNSLKKGSLCLICKTKGTKKEADIYLPAHRLPICKEHYLDWVVKRVEETIKEFRMIKRDDRILVAVSGGKDSLALWDILIKLGYEADGFYINLGIGEYSEDSKELAIKFSKEINRTLHIISLKDEILPIPKLKEKFNKPTCSVCGTVKRYYMNKKAKELGYNVLATGHNLDDEVAVLFKNVLTWDINYLSRQYPVLEEEDGFVRKVKPLCRMSEKEMALYSFFRGIEYIEYECPFAEGASTIETKKFISALEEKSPGMKLQFYNSFLKRVYPLMKDKDQKVILKSCKICGEPSVNDTCSVCNMKLKIEDYTKS
jgi:uncharacterized protein (TIGR00269 family)